MSQLNELMKQTGIPWTINVSLKKIKDENFLTSISASKTVDGTSSFESVQTETSNIKDSEEIEDTKEELTIEEKESSKKSEKVNEVEDIKIIIECKTSKHQSTEDSRDDSSEGTGYRTSFEFPVAIHMSLDEFYADDEDSFL